MLAHMGEGNMRVPGAPGRHASRDKNERMRSPFRASSREQEGGELADLLWAVIRRGFLVVAGCRRVPGATPLGARF